MKEIDQLTRAKNILTSVLGTAVHNMGEKYVVQEAKNHIKTAIRKLESLEQKSRKPYRESTEKLTVGPQTGPVLPKAEPMKPEVAKTVLAGLNAMIIDERKKLDELEKKSQQISDGDGEGKLLTN